MVIGNEMGIFITLSKYNTQRRREEGKPLLVFYYFVSILCYLSRTLPNGQVWHKAFYGWSGRSAVAPDTPGSSKIASGSVGIPLKKGASGTR